MAWECHLDSEEERTEASVLAAAAALEQVEVEASDPKASEQRSRPIICAAMPVEVLTMSVAGHHSPQSRFAMRCKRPQ